MKKLFLFFILLLCQLQIGFCQFKITKATQQKTFGGMGGVFMSYVIEVKSKSNAIVVDSIKPIADTSSLRFSTMKIKTGNYQITFGFAIIPPAKCKTCVETTPIPPNMTKGILIYCRKGKEKSGFRIKKFKRLPDVMLP